MYIGKMNVPYLTVAIPTMRRWSFLRESLPTYLNNPIVGEVIICDETGEDVNTIACSDLRSHPKLRLILNDSILGIYQNKLKCLSLARFPRIALLDSDNYFLDSWFERLHSVIDINNPKVIYESASFLWSNIETSETKRPASSFVDTRISKSNWNSILKKPGWNFLLNDGNWVVSKQIVDVLNPYKKSNSLYAADAIYMLREFIVNGYEIWYVPGLDYIHTVHSNSSWLLTESQSTRILLQTPWGI